MAKKGHAQTGGISKADTEEKRPPVSQPCHSRRNRTHEVAEPGLGKVFLCLLIVVRLTEDGCVRVCPSIDGLCGLALIWLARVASSRINRVSNYLRNA
jgi:hypothetical protein